MKRQILRSFLLILIAALFTACEKPTVIEDPELLAHLNTDAVDTLIFSSHRYYPDAELWRSFTHGGPVNKKTPLIALVSFINSDSTEIAAELNITRLYVIEDQKIWVSIPVLSSDNTEIFKQEKVSNDGPEWQTGILADVIIEVSNKTTKDKYLLIKKAVTIEKAE